MEIGLAIGKHEIRWQLTGYDDLVATIDVTDIGVVCKLVTGGSCNSITPPGVVVSQFTVTGYLKLAAVAPCKLAKPVLKVVDLTSDFADIAWDPIPILACCKASPEEEVYYNVWFNGKAQTPSSATHVDFDDLTPGTKYTIDVQAIPYWKTWKCEASDIASITFTTPTLGVLGSLYVTSVPAGARIWIDYQSSGTFKDAGYSTNIKIGVPAGTHRVKVIKSGYKEPSPQTVTVKVDETKNVSFTLESALPVTTMICTWINETGHTKLTKAHAIYTYLLSTGATSAADSKYAKLSPQPSRLDSVLATKNNALGVYLFSIGSVAGGNLKTKCAY